MVNDKDKCPVCEENDEHDEDGTEWICCSTCEQWVHVVCIELDPIPPKEEQWYCDRCIAKKKVEGHQNNGESTTKSIDGKNVTDNPTLNKHQDRVVNDDERELEMLNELIKQQARLCELQQRQLEVMSRISQKSESRNIEGWLNGGRDGGAANVMSDPVPQKSTGEITFIQHNQVSDAINSLNLSVIPNRSGDSNSNSVANTRGIPTSSSSDITSANHVSKTNASINPNAVSRPDSGQGAFPSSISNQNDLNSDVLHNTTHIASGISTGRMDVNADMASILKAQMQLMCRTYLEDLPTFDGDIEFWPIFFAQFKSTTEQANFDDAHNLCRLRKALKGEALECVKGLLALPNSLPEVIQILQQRFGCMDVIVRRKMKGLNDLQPPNENKPNTVRHFHEYLRSVYATLKNAGADEYLCSPQTLDVVVHKLPPSILRSWLLHKRQMNDRAVLNDFIFWFERYYNCAILCDRDQSNEKPIKRGGNQVNFHSNIDSKKSGNTLASTSAEQCSYCRKTNHKFVNCNSFLKLPLRKKWDIVRKHRLCFICLLGKHNYKDCTNAVDCDVNGCKEKHNRILHKPALLSSKPKDNDLTVEIAATVNDCQLSRKIHFRVVPVILHNPNNLKQIVTWAFFDEGSSPTMMSEAMATRLGVSGKTDELCMAWTDSSVKKEPKSQRVSIDISGVGMDKRYRLHNVRTVGELNLPMPEYDIDELKAKFTHLSDITIPDIPKMKPELLIGLEHAKLGLTREYREGAWNEPIATRSRLGWSIHGKEVARGSFDYLCHVCECDENYRLDDLVRQFFSTESFGVKLVEKQLISKEEERTTDLLEKTTRKIGLRYETGLLWRSENVKLPDNKMMTMRRLVCFEQKLRKDAGLQKFVLDKVADHLEKGYLRKLSPEEVDSLINRRHWYLPIFVVANINKSNKARLVFDAAAKYRGISLNDVLLKGPDQLASLFGVLLRFREGKVALTADIAEMFHRVQIRTEDQYSQLVLWRNLDANRSAEIYAMTAMTFGSTCSPSSAQYIKNLNASRFIDEMPRAVDAIIHRHYVDDWLDSFSSETEAIQIARQVQYIHGQGGFQIRNWVSNSQYVQHVMNTNDDYCEVYDLNVCNDMGEEKVLGLQWKTSTDEFIFKISFSKVNPSIVAKSQVPSKREVLKVLMSVYDPLGFLSILTVFGKIFLQNIWRTGIQWDEEIPNDMIATWHDWLDSIYNIKNVRVLRWYFVNGSNVNSVELHVLCDASESAFAACAYFRYADSKDNKFKTTFVAARTKVAPQKALSIPRLELQACVLASRLFVTINSELSIRLSRVVMWTDSQTALGWIRSSKRKYSSFVSHRVSEILDSTVIEQWRWIPSRHNVADDATRGVNQPNISARWFTGPDFLGRDSSCWPKEKHPVNTTDEEVRQIFVNLHMPEQSIIQPSRFSKYERLLRSTAYIIRFISAIKSGSKYKRREKRSSLQQLFKELPSLNVREMEKAEVILFRKIQSDAYGSELAMLKAEKSISRKSKIYPLNPYLDKEGLVRLSSRVDASPVISEEHIKRPILLDPGHEITVLLVDWVHRKFHHRMKESVVNELRQRLWIPKIRVLVNRVIKNCNLCKYQKAKPIIPKMAPLPPQRLQPFYPAFTFTGIDFFGPLEVAVGRRREKRWGTIFTCMTSRAIHLELASSLDTNSAIMCFRNFANRRGTPLEVFSDNGTNLRAAEKELRLEMKRLDMEQIKDSIILSNPCMVKTKWTFIPPGAPHFGGTWERMIRSVKSVLYIILQSRAPQDETLRSALIEIENIVNSRPLTYSPADIDSSEAITPNLLLRGPVQETVAFPGEFDCRKQWRISQAFADAFWKRWLLEYIPLIAHRSKWHADNPMISIGQIVLVIDETLRRNEWKKGVVTKTFPSKDGRIRSAEVRTARNTYVRPVSKLAVIKGEVVAAINSNLI